MNHHGVHNLEQKQLKLTVSKSNINDVTKTIGVTINEIIQWNNLSNKSIYPGQKIKIII